MGLGDSFVEIIAHFYVYFDRNILTLWNVCMCVHFPMDRLIDFSFLLSHPIQKQDHCLILCFACQQNERPLWIVSFVALRALWKMVRFKHSDDHCVAYAVWFWHFWDCRLLIVTSAIQANILERSSHDLLINVFCDFFWWKSLCIN